MKKIVLLIALVMGATAAQAQVTNKGSKFSDNWSLTLKGGAVSPMNHFAFWKNARGIAGLELRKQVTSVLGLGLESEVSFNTSSWYKPGYATAWADHSNNIVDHQLVGMFGTINFNNWFVATRAIVRLSRWKPWLVQAGGTPTKLANGLLTTLQLRLKTRTLGTPRLA